MQGPTPSAFLERHINLCSPTRHLCAVHLYSGMSHSNSVHNRVHTSPLLDPILIRVNPTHIVTPYFLEVNFNIILPSIISLPSDMCSSGTAVKILISSHPSLRATRSSPSLSLGDIPESCFYSSRVPFQYIWFGYLLQISIDTRDIYCRSIHEIFTADIDRYTRRPNPCGIVLWQGFLNSPSTWVKHFTLPFFTLYPLLYGQSHISFCQITSCHACRHSVLPGATAFQKFQGKQQIRAADKITIRIVVYSISIRWIYIDFQSTRKTTTNSDC